MEQQEEQSNSSSRPHRRPLTLPNPENEVRPVGTFHWTSDAANTLWLTGWIPGNENEYLSACLGLFLMAVLARGLAGIKVSLAAWLHAQEYHRHLLPLAIRNNINSVSSDRRRGGGVPGIRSGGIGVSSSMGYSPNNDNGNNNKRSSRMSAFFQHQRSNNTTRVGPSNSNTNNVNNDDGIQRDSNKYSTPSGTIVVTTPSTVVAEAGGKFSSATAAPQPHQQQQHHLVQRPADEFISMYVSDLSDNDGDDDDNDDATTYMTAASIPYSIKSRRRGNARKPSMMKTRAARRSMSSAATTTTPAMKRKRTSVEPLPLLPPPPMPMPQAAPLSSFSVAAGTSSTAAGTITAPTTIMPWVPPFAWKPDILRSICATLEHFLMFLLIMVVMTGNVPYLISILAGILVGEMMFGRLHGVIPRLPVYKYLHRHYY